MSANKNTAEQEHIDRHSTLISTLKNDPVWRNLSEEIHLKAILLGNSLTYDFREMLTQADNVENAGILMWKLIKPYKPEVLVGPGLGATPLLYGIAAAALKDGENLSIMMVRDKRKEHNRRRWVEGAKFRENARAIIIDDFLGKGSAIALVEEALRADGRKLQICAVAIFYDLWEPLGSRQISLGRYPVVSLFKRHDIGLSRDCHDAAPPLMKGEYPDFIDKPQWWRFNLNGHTDHPLKCSPVIADNAVFVGDDHSRIWRFDGETGETDWQYQSLGTPLKGIVQRLQFADNSISFGCYDGTVTRLDCKTGDVVWRWRQDSHVHATPEVDLANQRIFVNTEQENYGAAFGHLIALDWRNGQLLWQHTHKYWPPASPVYSALHNLVMATCNDKTLTCVDANNGEIKWQKKTRGMVRGKPGINSTSVFVASETGYLQSYDLVTGDEKWSRRHGAPNRHQFLHTDEEFVYVLDGQYHLSAFNTTNGELCWISKLRAKGVTAPVPFGQHFIVLSENGAIAVIDSRKKIKLWESYAGGHYQQPPAVGYINDQPFMALASNASGLKAFKIHSYYDQSHD
ncbi:PQQ-binding-like beta-propeller repeat protein [Undibacterium sp. Ji49W]|uniref:outer membrane protein assembly factor BamB family protein n=1 Tax=Undibacterium sp. Ji49W TaxID=3413040 RepID=UPI003BF023E7